MPSDTKTEQLSSEISKIKAWFENNAHASNLTNCNSNRNFQPRWDRSRDGGDRLEFDIFEDGKIPMPKFSGTGLKSGRMKFVSKKNNGNGNANGQGIIVSFIPFQSFTGDISKVSTSNFRVMNFDGIIAFDELNGCSGNAYKVDKGVVMNKLTIATPNQLNPRCGESYTSTTYHYTMVSSPAYPQNGCSISYYAAGTSTSYGVPCLDAPMVGSGGNYGNSSASSTDATYSGYLAPPPISVLCVSSIGNGLSAPQSAGSFTSGSANGCLPNQSVHYISSIFADLQVVGIGFSSSANMPFVDIAVTGLASLPLTPNALAAQISSAYGVARQNYFMNTPNGGNIVFAQAWMDAFNNSSTNIGRYCLDITPLGSINGNSPAAFQLLDNSSPNCR